MKTLRGNHYFRATGKPLNSAVNKALALFGISPPFEVSQTGSGLIHKTWKVTASQEEYILQKINHHVFTRPFDIAENLRLLDSFVKASWPEYPFVAPLGTQEGETMATVDDEFYRLTRFVKNSHTLEVVGTPEHAYQAAYHFGLFAKVFISFPSQTLNETIPGFHNLEMRYRQFEQSLTTADPQRLSRAWTLIDKLHHHAQIVKDYTTIENRSLIRRRVTHHDTKISNVLFDKSGKGICVIDLDTVMPGFFISDLGDMMRTYLSPTSEETADLASIHVRDEYFEAITSGYLENMADCLDDDEKQFIFYSGSFLIFMQAIRFLTDYLNDDVYYGASYDEHNYIRASNQVELLKRYEEKKGDLRKYY